MIFATAVSSSTQSTEWVQWWDRDIDSVYEPLPASGQALTELEISFEFKDQGWGNAEGYVLLELVNEHGSTLASRAWFYSVDDRPGYKAETTTFAANHNMVSLFESGSGYDYALAYMVGGGGGHAIYVTRHDQAHVRPKR